MKKLLFLGLVIVVSVGLIYCGTKDKELAKIEKEPKVELSTKKVITKGAIKVFNEETGQWETAEMGKIELKKNVKINTTKDAEMKVEVTKDNYIAVSGGSEVKVKEIAKTQISGRERVALELVKGKLSAKVRPLKKGEYFKIVTPVATAGVRGTKFDVEVAEDNTTTVMCLSGAVEVKSNLKRARTDIADFQKVVVNPKGVILPTEKLSKDEIEKLMNIKFDEFRAGIVE